MGSTISVARKAGAIRGVNGKIHYALFEKTYEQNCHPHIPEWGCIGFGTGPDMVRRVFLLASETCSGMLRRPSGRFTPIGYIDSWMQALRNPHVMSAERVDIEVSKTDSLLAGIRQSDLASVIDRLTRLGYGHVADSLEMDGRYHIKMLADEVDVFLAITEGRAIWRYIHEHDLQSAQNPALGWHPAASVKKPTVPLPGRFRIHGLENLVIETADGEWTIGEWEYRHKGEYVKACGEAEATQPGHYRKLLKALKLHLEQLPFLPDDTRIEIDQSRSRKGFVGCAEAIVQILGSEQGELGQIPLNERNLLGHLGGALTIRLPESSSVNRYAMTDQAPLNL